MVSARWKILAWVLVIVIAACFFLAGYFAANMGMDGALHITASVIVGLFCLGIFICVLVSEIGAGYARDIESFAEGFTYAVVGEPISRGENCFVIITDEDSQRGNLFFARCKLVDFPINTKIVRVVGGKLVPFSQT